MAPKWHRRFHPAAVTRASEPHATVWAVMAGLVPAIHALQITGMRAGWVYIVTNRPNGTLYLGVTSDLSLRIWQHRTGAIPGFTK